MIKTELKVGEIVQLSPTDVGNKAFAGCPMVVEQPKVWGAMGYVTALGDNPETPGGRAYYRATWEEMEQTNGTAKWT